MGRSSSSTSKCSRSRPSSRDAGRYRACKPDKVAEPRRTAKRVPRNSPAAAAARWRERTRKTTISMPINGRARKEAGGGDHRRAEQARSKPLERCRHSAVAAGRRTARPRQPVIPERLKRLLRTWHLAETPEKRRAFL
jgi:hypothetical protein